MKENINMNRLRNFVVGGGGTWGYAYVGAVEGLFKSSMYDLNDYKNIKNYVGCSIGSIITSMMACGGSIEEMKSLMKEIDLNKAQDDSWGWCRDLYRLFNHYGFYKGDYIEENYRMIIDKLFKNEFKRNKSRIGKKKSGFTFDDVYKQFGKNLIINGVNVNTREIVYFNRLTHPNMEVAVACRISSGLPLIFKAYNYEGDYYIDGGVVDSYPIRYCTTRIFEMLDSCNEYTKNDIKNAVSESIDLIRDDTNTELIEKTIGIKGYDNRTFNYVENGRSDRIEEFTFSLYIKEVIGLVMDQGAKHYIDSHLWNKTVKLNMGDKSVANFDLSKKDIQDLIDLGISASNNYVNTKILEN